MEPNKLSIASTPPKIQFFTLPAKRPDPPGMTTPPLRPAGAIPFSWEEAPGRPKSEPGLPPLPCSGKSLDPPPGKLAEEMKFSSVTSPTTVLDGPYCKAAAAAAAAAAAKLSSESFSYGEERSLRFNEKAEKKKQRIGKGVAKNGRMSFGPLDCGGAGGGVSHSSFNSLAYPSPFSSSSSSLTSSASSEKETKVTIWRMTKSTSVGNLSSSHASSHFWARIYRGLKHAAPWRKSRKG